MLYLGILLLVASAGAAPPTLRAVDPPAGPGSMGPSLLRLGDGLALTWLELLDPADRARFLQGLRNAGLED